MSESLFAKELGASVGVRIPRWSFAVLAAGQLLLCLAALASSYEAALSAFAVSLLALFRYFSLGLFAASIGVRKGVVVAVEGGLWLLSFLALGAAIVIVARIAHAALLWAAAAACLGPLLITILAILAGGRAFVGVRGASGGAR